MSVLFLGGRTSFELGPLDMGPGEREEGDRSTSWKNSSGDDAFDEVSDAMFQGRMLSNVCGLDSSLSTAE